MEISAYNFYIFCVPLQEVLDETDCGSWYTHPRLPSLPLPIATATALPNNLIQHIDDAEESEDQVSIFPDISEVDCEFTIWQRDKVHVTMLHYFGVEAEHDTMCPSLHEVSFESFFGFHVRVWLCHPVRCFWRPGWLHAWSAGP